MIIVLFFAAVTIIGLVMMRKTDSFDTANTVGTSMFACGLIVSVVVVVIVLSNHVGISVKMANDNIRYESLCKRKEIIESQYEDVSKSDIIKDIAEWNADVNNHKYWAYNPLTSWFYSRKAADNMKTIDMDSNSVLGVNNG